MKCHLQSFVAVFIVHIMDDIQSVDIQVCQPIAHTVKFAHDFFVIQIFGCDRRQFRTNLIALALIFAAIDGIEESLGQICTGTKELHLFPDAHSGNTAGYSIIIAEFFHHQIIIFILNG